MSTKNSESTESQATIPVHLCKSNPLQTADTSATFSTNAKALRHNLLGMDWHAS